MSLTLMMRVCDGEFLSQDHMYSVKREPGRLECKTVGDLIVAFIILCNRWMADCSIEAQHLVTIKKFISVLKLSHVSLNRWLNHKYQKAEVVKSVWRR